MNEKERQAIRAKLSRSRGQVQSKLTVLETYLNSFNSEIDNVVNLKSRLKLINELDAEYKQVHDELAEYLDLESDDVVQAHDSKYIEFFTKFCSVKANYEVKIGEIDEEAGTVITSGGTKVAEQSKSESDQPFKIAKLPTISLVHFGGNVREWISFKETFEGLVNSRTDLNEAVKFHYLKSILESDAKNLIEKFPCTAAGYKEAWEALISRYDNKRIIIESHITELFKLKTVMKESSFELRRLLEDCSKNLRALSNLGEPIEQWNSVIVHMVAFRLDAETRKHWEGKIGSVNEMPKWKDLEQFLQNRCRVLESLDVNKRKGMVVANQVKSKIVSSVETKNFVSQELKCEYCSRSHSLKDCNKFLEMSASERSEKVKQLKLCFKCLRKGHRLRDCKVENCSKCSKNHHVLLHFPCRSEIEEAKSLQVASTSNSFSGVSSDSHVLLSTAVISVKNSAGKWCECRVVLDNASQSNFCSEEFAKILGIKLDQSNIMVKGIGGSCKKVLYKIVAEIKSIVTSYCEKLRFEVIPEVVGILPTVELEFQDWKLPQNIMLADKKFNQPQKIDMLLGAEVFYDLLLPGKLKSKKGEPILQNTEFGWVAGGRVNDVLQANQLSHCNSVIIDLNEEIKRLWELNDMGKQKRITKEETFCENHFLENHYRKENGQYVVKMPFKVNCQKLRDSKAQAIKRFHYLENKLNKNPEMKRDYGKFMSEYKELQHMTKVENPNFNDQYFVLPHHPVVKADSTTTKLRVVFDGSASTTSGLSINDLLLNGPVIQEELFDIVLRFRKHNVAMCADIEKMFRMVEMASEDRKFQMIIWRENNDEELSFYELNTITYGMSSSTFLSTRVVQQLFKDEAESFPIAAGVLGDFYVDDYIGGAESVEDGLKLQSELIEMFERGKMHLRKWCSNRNELLSNLSREKVENLSRFDDSAVNETIKTLGIVWNPKEDQFMFIDDNKVINNTFTKRDLLSDISKIFDPLGIIGPVRIIGKVLMQKLWMQKVGWDEEMPDDLLEMYRNHKKDLQKLRKFKINRFVLGFSHPKLVELHAFSDASETAYGCCLYIKSVSKNGEISVNLLCSRSRVTPLKKISLARLELCAALELARLVDKVYKAMKINFDKVLLWTDSTIVLAWIKLPAYNLKTFVGNRISEIQELNPEFKWYHVRSECNPADVLSRGINATNLMNSKIWWFGPDFLRHDNIIYSDRNLLPIIENLPELKKAEIICAANIINSTFIENYSCIRKLQRLIAYWLRFINNKFIKNERITGCLKVYELRNSLCALVRITQKESFKKEYNDLQNNKVIDAKSELKSLNPFMKNGIIRVGGRLKNSNLAYDCKHQILLPKNNHFTERLIEQFHVENGHIGQQALLSVIRRKFWPIHGKIQIRKVVRKCLLCSRIRPRFVEQFMGDLPPERVIFVHPFFNVGLDYAGPIFIKVGGIRSKTLQKAYICVFVCLSTKCVHLELAENLTTQAFIDALVRFVSRRGKPASLRSDNATNFKGANRELNDIYEFWKKDEHRKKIDVFCADMGIQWSFIPPRSPSFGGLWEAAVKSMKYNLIRMIKNAHLTSLEMVTVLSKIEAIMNSRPLVPESNDPEDLSAITPGHFLIGRPITAVLELDYSDENLNKLTRVQRLRQITQQFWKKWSYDYLSELQKRVKWFKKEEQFCIGQLALLMEENIHPLSWRMGRIVELHSGKDGIVRVLTLKTKNGNFKRAVNKICLLPVEVDTSSAAKC